MSIEKSDARVAMLSAYDMKHADYEVVLVIDEAGKA